MKARNFLLAILTAGMLATSVAPAVSCTMSELAQLQIEWSQLVERFMNGAATLQDLVEFQRKLSECQSSYGSPNSTPPVTLADLAALQVEYAKLVEKYRSGNATLQELSQFQQSLAAFRKAYISVQPGPERCGSTLAALQAEWAALMEAFMKGKATLRDIVEFQRKLAAFRDCFYRLEVRTAGSVVNGGDVMPAEPSSWGHIKALYED